MQSSVDVIIPCHNYGRFLRTCAESVLSQQGADVRVLVIDDCSPDDTPDVASALAREDRRVMVRRHTVNRGHIASYNEGIIWADADYLMILSADDVLAPGALARAAKVMNAHPAIGMTCGRHISFRDDSELVECMSERQGPTADEQDAVRVIDEQDLLALACQRGETSIEAPTVIVRRALQQRLGGYRAELPHAADTEMWLRFAHHAPIGVLDAVQAYKRVHTGNMTWTFTGDQHALQHKAAFDAHFDRFGGQIRGIERWRATLNRTIAEQIFWIASGEFDQGRTERCDELLAMAADICPALRTSKSWRRLRLKRLVGRRLSSALRPLLRWAAGPLLWRAEPAGRQLP